MSDNPKLVVPWETELPGIGVVTLQGTDAAAFAQSQLMNDVSGLAVGQWQWNGWLSAKGRVLALFALLRAAQETFWLVGTADADQLATAVSRYRFRSKVRIDAPPCRALGRFDPPHAARGSMAWFEGTDAVELDLGGDAGARALRLELCEPGATRLPDDKRPDDTLLQCWWALDIAQGWPALPGAVLDAWTPQQLSLERLAAFSVRKGCYPGQEIVARTHFLGRAKRGLLRIEGVGVKVGASVVASSGDVLGAVVCAAGAHGLAVMPLDVDDAAQLHAGGFPCTPHTMLGGLQR